MGGRGHRPSFYSKTSGKPRQSNGRGGVFGLKSIGGEQNVKGIDNDKEEGRLTKKLRKEMGSGKELLRKISTKKNNDEGERWLDQRELSTG